jgi:hypothetical protein
MDRRGDSSPTIEVVIRVALERPISNNVEVGPAGTAPPDDAMWRPDGSEPPGRHLFREVELTESGVSVGKEHRLPSPATASRRPKRGRNRRRGWIAAAAVVAVTLVGAVSLRSTRSPAITAAPTSTIGRSGTPSAAGARWVLLDGEDSARSTSSQASASLSHRCRHLLVAAPVVLGAEPATWIVSLLSQGGRPGQTLDDVVHDRLVTARTAFRRAHPSAAEALRALDAVVADAADQPCSSAACTGDRIDLISTPRNLGRRPHAGWRWLCAS